MIKKSSEFILEMKRLSVEFWESMNFNITTKNTPDVFLNIVPGEKKPGDYVLDIMRCNYGVKMQLFAVKSLQIRIAIKTFSTISEWLTFYYYYLLSP